MDTILQDRLKVAKQERTEIMGEFLNLKKELLSAQQRNMILQEKNLELREELKETENTANNLLSFAKELDL